MDSLTEMENQLTTVQKRLKALEDRQAQQDKRLSNIVTTLDELRESFDTWHTGIEQQINGFVLSVKQLSMTVSQQSSDYSRVLSALEQNNTILKTHTDITRSWSDVIETVNQQVAANTLVVSDVNNRLKTLTYDIDSTDERVGQFANKTNNLETNQRDDRKRIMTMEEKLEVLNVGVALLERSVSSLTDLLNRIVGIFTPKNIIIVCVIVATLLGLDTGAIQDVLNQVGQLLGG